MGSSRTAMKHNLADDISDPDSLLHDGVLSLDHHAVGHGSDSKDWFRVQLIQLRDICFLFLEEIITFYFFWNCLFNCSNTFQIVEKAHKIHHFSIFFGKYYFLWHWVLFFSRFPMRPSFPAPQGLQPLCHPSKFSPRTERIQEQSRWDFLSKLMDSWLVCRRNRVILNQCTKWNNRSFKWLPKTSFIGRLPIR